ncbi:hypothetical protein [Nioella sp. MMSF_3534]|uniref:hypothetical protein n=1 Tax=Nioella sp. MMSF_3534 TaxID=3046720 RepID=UPI00273E6ADE|nr:hypothetical protein [Nioella sp. MMSF_3534]
MTKTGKRHLFTDDYNLDDFEQEQLTGKTRETFLDQRHIRKTRHAPGHAGHPLGVTNYYEELEGKDISGDVWKVTLCTRIGVNEPYYTTRRFVSEEEADAFIEKARAERGTSVFGYAFGLTDRRVNEFGAVIGYGHQSIPAAMAESTCFKILWLAGVLDDSRNFIAEPFDFSEAGWNNWVSEFERRFAVKCNFEVLNAIVAWHYCRENFHFTSITYLAAAIYFSAVAKRDDITVGYLFRELELTLSKVESDALRGKKILQFAKSANDVRRKELAAQRAQILAEMDHRIQAGKNVSEAARLAHEKGFGASKDANRQLYYRHRDKRAKIVVTHPATVTTSTC